jgi:hypothetical protein
MHHSALAEGSAALTTGTGSSQSVFELIADLAAPRGARQNDVSLK